MLEPKLFSRILSMLPAPASAVASCAPGVPPGRLRSPSTPPFTETAFIARSSLSQILDENHFVALGAVDQLIGEALRHEQAESAGPDTELAPQFQMPQGIVGTIGDGGVRQRIHGKAFSGIADVVHNASGGADVAQIHDLLRIQMSAVLDGIHEQLAKRSGDLFALVGLEFAGQFAHELRQTLGGREPAADLE